MKRVRRAAPRKSTPKPNARDDVLPSDGANDGSVVEGIIETIKEGIRVRRFAPGQRLIEVDIRRSVGASRGPVREAMRRLAAEGLVDLKHQKGARVREFSPTEVIDLYRVREVLEGLLVRLVAENIGRKEYRAELLALEEEFADLDKSPNSYRLYNERFHDLVVKMCESEFLVRLVQQLHAAAYVTQQYTHVDQESVEPARRHHKDIAGAILNGNGAKAERLMRQHVRSRLDKVVAALPKTKRERTA